MAVVCFVSFFVLPAIVAFDLSLEARIFYSVIWNIIDIITFMDLMFITIKQIVMHGTKMKDGETIDKWWWMFLYPWFYFDLIAGIPTSIISTAICGHCNLTISHKHIRLIYFNKLFKIWYTFLMITRILAMLMFSTYGDVKRICSLSFSLYFLVQIVGTLWIVVGEEPSHLTWLR